MNPNYAKAVLIYNPTAGRRRRRRAAQLERVKKELAQSGISLALQATTAPGSGAALAREAVHDGAGLIIVCGGDGTINEVVCGMAHSQVPLAILPGGTANGLARELRLPLDIEAAARLIPTATPRRIALGRVGDRYFLSMAGVGFDAQVLTKIEGRWKDRLGMTYYGMQALRQAVFEGFTPFTISAGEKRLEATFACIARAQHYGPFRMVREADLFSDQFYVYCFRSGNRRRYLAYALAFLQGSLNRLPDVTRFAARSVSCEQIPGSSAEVLFQVDGELAGRLPCRVEIVPDALVLLAPAQGFGPQAGRRLTSRQRQYHPKEAHRVCACVGRAAGVES